MLNKKAVDFVNSIDNKKRAKLESNNPKNSYQHY